MCVLDFDVSIGPRPVARRASLAAAREALCTTPVPRPVWIGTSIGKMAHFSALEAEHGAEVASASRAACGASTLPTPWSAPLTSPAAEPSCIERSSVLIASPAAVLIASKAATTNAVPRSKGLFSGQRLVRLDR